MPQPTETRRSFGRRIAYLLAAPWLAYGCRSDDGEGDAVKSPLAGKAVRAMVLDDAALAKVIVGVQAQWQAETGATLTISEGTVTEVLDGDAAPQADVIVYPSTSIGEFAARGWLADLPDAALRAKGYQWHAIFESLTQREAAWGSRTVAAPLGSRPLVLFYRADILDKLDRAPPRSWEEYHRLAGILADRSNWEEGDAASDAPWSGAIEPLAEGHAAVTLLARAAAYAKHPSHYSTLFNLDGMQPAIANPAFVRALEELIADREFGREEALSGDQAREAFWRGECGMAIAYGASRLSSPGDIVRPEGLVAGFARLPGAVELFGPEGERWERRAGDELTRVSLLGVSGRLVSLVGDGANDAAMNFLQWITGVEWSERIATASAETAPFRPEHLRLPSEWLGAPATGGEAAKYTLVVQEALGPGDVLLAPRIPGHDEYMRALDEAVRDAVGGKLEPAEALSRAAKAWDEITDRIGRAAQIGAYQRSVGI